MARPQLYDDEELLLIMAEVLTWPESSGVTQPTDAARRAIETVPGSNEWKDHIVAQTLERLLKAWRTRGDEFRTKVANRPRIFAAPLLPTLLTPPNTPERALSKQVASELRVLSAWVNDLASVIDNPEGGHSDAVRLAQSILRKVVAVVEADRKNSTS